MKKHPHIITGIIFLFLATSGMLQAQDNATHSYAVSFKNQVHQDAEDFKVRLAGAIEDVSKRTAYSTTWTTKTGSIIIRYSLAPIKYDDVNSDLLPADKKAITTSLITGPTATWSGGSTPSCIYPNFHTDSILVTVPGGINVTYFTVDYAYVTNPSNSFHIPLSDGIFYLSTSCANTDTIGCIGDSAGICYLTPYLNFSNPMTSCLTSSCSPQSFWLDAHLARYYGGVGCDTTAVWYSKGSFVGFQYYFSAYVEGIPIIQISKVTTPDLIPCNGTAKVTPTGGTAPYTYLWTPNNQTTDSIGSLCVGTYCCNVTDSKGCTDSICINISNSSGINSIRNASSINIYPDPNSGNFTVSGLIPGQRVEIYNYTGQLIQTVISDKTLPQFNIKDKSDGVYLVRVLNKDGSFVTQKKIIKQL